MKNFPEVRVLSDKDKYERTKIGLEDSSPYNSLYVEDTENEDSTVEGLEEMIDFVPENNPIKAYYRDIKEE